MNKEELKNKWGKYCDTDKLVDDMMSLLTKYGHRNSEYGVCVVLNKYFKAKEPLIKLFATSNHYAGNMRIVMAKEFERNMDKGAIKSFCSGFSNIIGANKMLLKYQDDDGKTMTDYLQTGSKKVNVMKIDNNEHVKSVQKGLKKFDKASCATTQSYKAFINFCDYIQNYFGYYYASQLNEDSCTGDVELKRGMKTSRAFNKVCAHYGIDKATNYDKLFAQYADMVSGNCRKLQFVISLNPLDYLTMSLGNSWHSCHSINAIGNNGYGSGACSGCVSYMLDKCSIITYVVDNTDQEMHLKGKIYRQMFHYNNNLFVQSRLYPQGNDGATNLYDKFRCFMYDEFTELLNLDKNEWENKVGNNVVRDWINHNGNHYPDTNYNRSVGIFYAKEQKDKIASFTVGSSSYCFYCGEKQDPGNRLSHQSCSLPRNSAEWLD